MSTDKLTLYTNHRCPWAHRAHIALKELNLSYEEVIIDLDTPREQWYLDINPRGLVPTLKYNDEIIAESSVVTRFLADLHPSPLLPPSNSPSGALTRARINFFVDTWFDKVGSYWFQILRADDSTQRSQLADEFVTKVAKEIDPLLADASPFFGGSEKVTLAEALVAPFVLRVLAFSERGLLPESVGNGLKRLPNFGKWAGKVVKEESVTYIWDEEAVSSATKKKIESLKKAAGK